MLGALPLTLCAECVIFSGGPFERDNTLHTYILVSLLLKCDLTVQVFHRVVSVSFCTIYDGEMKRIW